MGVDHIVVLLAMTHPANLRYGKSRPAGSSPRAGRDAYAIRALRDWCLGRRSERLGALVVTGNFLHEHHDPAPQGGIINSHERSDQP